MTEPMESFAEWRCASCARVELVPTVRAPAGLGLGALNRIRWPMGWRILASRTFAWTQCDRCLAREHEDG